MNGVDWSRVLENLFTISIITTFSWIFGVLSWVFWTTIKNRRDINQMFPVLRRIEKKIFGE